ncbi:MarR family winged helix-turn-helix transcriptional regulator [Nocardioides humi]|uniref:HTH marR-type domain-containing protein n=1 Tax=Nocardioides humi TaxID=449461 RepID=A0ABN1ZYL1_9ACTN|nr:MarR family winged helix-turn-helix transcriptional regulator [Nocardioides humi]
MTSLHRVADRPTWLLSRANARAQGLLGEAFAAAGVRGYHYRLLAALEEHGPSSQADLGRATGIDRSDVVATLDDLVGWRLARRDPDPADRRRNVVTLTRAGGRRLVELDGVLDGVQEAVLEPLTRSERRTLLALLARLS